MKIEKIIPALIRASLEKDLKTVETLSLTLLRIYRKSNPLLSEDIAKILSYKKIGASSYRSIGINPSPVDEGSRFPLVKITEPTDIIKPILSIEIQDSINQFVKERSRNESLLKYGIKPSNSILLYGEPGVGKTYTAKWLSKKLDLPLITIDLSSTISSYLGKTGQNIKQILEYAKSYNSILFLDEFDAIAKKRDDQSDIGELKRIVNVLLKELEEWPTENIVIAATNHPEILDKAIWRRFDKHLELKTLDKNLTLELITREMSVIEITEKKDIDLIAYFTDESSPADIVRICEAIKKKYILSETNESLKKCIYSEVKECKKTIINNKELCVKLKKEIPGITAKEIIEFTELSQTTVYRYFREEKEG